MGKHVEWERLAEPQADNYDSVQVLELGLERGYTLQRAASPVMKFDGRVAVLPNYSWDSRQFRPASIDDPTISVGCDIIHTWPSAFEQCRSLLSAIFVSNTVGADARTWGSYSGPGSCGFGSVCATVDHPVGFAEAIVHEMAHHKLRAIGVDFESASELLANPPGEVFPSPIRYDKLRPMSAVLHAEYSYTYIAALDIAAIRADNPMSEDIARFSLAKYLPKLDFGIRVLQESAVTDSAGARFLTAFSCWVEEVLAHGRKILSERGMSFEKFVHPLRATSGQ
jgi:HEXXH motif-containing protein